MFDSGGLGKSRWSQAGQKDVVTYMQELRDRLQRIMTSVKENVDIARDGQKRYYDRQSMERKLKAGDQVLVLQPLCSSTMFAQYGGPHTVTCDLRNDVYEIQLDRRRAPLNFNMLKQYIN